MDKVNFLKKKDLYPFFNPNGDIIEDIKRVAIQHTCPVILVEDKEELVEILNKKYKLNIIELLGIYRVEYASGFYYIYYK